MTRLHFYTEEEIAWLADNRTTPKNLVLFREIFNRPDVTSDQLACARKYRGIRSPKFKNYLPSKHGYAMIHDGKRGRLKHKVLWEKANGPIPEGMKLSCIDGDKGNYDPSNWEPLPEGLIARMGLIRREVGNDPEVRPSVLALAKLQTELANLPGSKREKRMRWKVPS